MMKVCINCHTENSLDEVFCSQCGMSLRRAATGEEAMRLKGEKRTPPEQPPSASGIVYLFAEQFVRPVPPRTPAGYASDVLRILQAIIWPVATAADMVLRFRLGLEDSISPSPVTDGRRGSSPVRAPYSGQPVWSMDLATRLFEAAFVALVQEGYIFLRVQKIEGLLPVSEAVAITLQKSRDDLPPSLERAIMEALRRDPKADCVKSAVARVKKPRTWFGQLSVVEIVFESLVATGWLYRLAGPAVETPEALLGELENAKAMLHTFATELPQLHKSLLREIEACA